MSRKKSLFQIALVVFFLAMVLSSADIIPYQGVKVTKACSNFGDNVATA